MWCWSRMTRISCTDRVECEEVLQRVKEDRMILQRIKRRNVAWINHILYRTWLLKHAIEGKTNGRIEVTERRRRRRKHLLDYRKGKRGYRKLRNEALDRSPWRTRFGRGYGPVLWEKKRMNMQVNLHCSWMRGNILIEETGNIQWRCVPLILCDYVNGVWNFEVGVSNNRTCNFYPSSDV